MQDKHFWYHFLIIKNVTVAEHITYLEDVVMNVSFSILYLGNFFPDGNESITEPVQFSLQKKK